MGARFPLWKPVGLEDSQRRCRERIHAPRRFITLVIWETMFIVSVIFKGWTRESNTGQILLVGGNLQIAE